MLFQGAHQDGGLAHDLRGHITYPSATGLGSFPPIASLPSTDLLPPYLGSAADIERPWYWLVRWLIIII